MNKNFYDAFKAPPREYGIFPITHSGIANPEHSIERFNRCNFAGTVGNIPYSKDFPDNTKDWENTEKGFRAFIENGMKTWIYDEKGYPSGSAGGAVLERNPSYEGVGLICFEYWMTLQGGPSPYRADIPDGELFKALLVPLTYENGEEVDITHTLNDSGTLYFDIPKGAYKLNIFVVRRLFDATHAAHSYSEPRRYLNLFDADATREFIKVTHENYAKYLRDEFGKGIKAFFTDEPSLIGWNITNTAYPMLSWDRRFDKKFVKRYGYAIEKAVIAVVKDCGPDKIKRRCDFWELISDEVADNFFGVIEDWCKENGTISSGHMLCEEKLIWHIFCYGSFYRSAKRLQYPGIDLLECDPVKLMSDAAIPIARLLASFADVYGNGVRESFTEASDHSSRGEGRQIPIDWIRASVNWHMAQGINNITSYFNFEYFSDEEIRNLNAYTARLGYALRQGERYSRTAVIYPEAALWTSFTPNGNGFQNGQSEQCVRLETVFAKTSWQLLNRQIDFDYIDEALINDSVPENGKLKYNGRTYECVILPDCFVLRADACKKLKMFTAAGGKVIAVNSLPKYDRLTGDLIDRTLLEDIIFADDGDIASAEKALPRSIYVRPGSINDMLSGHAGNIKAGVNVLPTVLSHVRMLENGEMLVFLCNMGAKKHDIVLGFDREIRSCTVFNPMDGESEVMKIENNAVGCSLRQYEGRIFIVD